MKIFNVLLVSFLFVATPWLSANNLPDKAHVSVSGTAKIQVKPDTVRIEFQSIAVENDSDDAKREVDKQVQQILSKLQKGGFDQALLKRSDLQMRPEYEYIEKKRTPVGVKATRNLSYQLGDVTKVNEFLQILVKSDISNIGQINYALKEPVQWQLKARDLAVKDSINKAKGLAKSYHASLGEVYSIHYQTNNAQPVLMRMVESDQMVPNYQNNEITITEKVDAVFLLGH
ncbi:SIMPL domain-containing protein [uncultured Psychromonas sp.]|uniref:SIMPL domain-containing protein n=1 Tax=uncultured Psychromonas sp. TaxID=173974 RepID=UPI00261BB899|nr:SIMPL domain-containing protein [uncultured Psychromonas sp.]